MMNRWKARVRLLGMASLSIFCAAFLLTMGPADAKATQITTPGAPECNGSLNGVGITSVGSSSPGDAISIPEHSDINVKMHSSSPDGWLRVQLAVLGFRYTVVNQTAKGTDLNSSVPVDKYAKYGVGLYQVVARVTAQNDPSAPACQGIMLVKIAGNPMSTPAGETAAAGVAIGLISLAAAGAGALAEGGSSKGLRKLGFCFFMTLPAILLTGGAMAGVGSPPPAPPVGPQQRVKWRPRFSFLGIVGGMLAGMSGLILLQQYSILYPTRTVGGVVLIGGLVFGVALPSLLRIFAVRRINRRQDS